MAYRGTPLMLVCFDVDGTLWTSNGPVTEAMLNQIELSPGGVVVIVSPSGARPLGWKESIEGPARRDSLKSASERWPRAVRLYVSDNNDQEEAEAAGYLYVDREIFAQMMRHSY